MSRRPRPKVAPQITDEFELAVHRDQHYRPNMGPPRFWTGSAVRVHTLTFAEMQMLMFRQALKAMVPPRIRIR